MNHFRKQLPFLIQVVFIIHVTFIPAGARGDHQVLLQGGDRLAIVQADGTIHWEMKWGTVHDIHLLPNGHILTRQGRAAVVEINPITKQIVWKYDAAKENGNDGKRVEVHAFERLSDGNTMIAESGTARIIEVDPQGELRLQIKLAIDQPHAHSDTRLVRRTPAGTYLVAHENDGCVREYDRENGTVVWEYEVPMFGKHPRAGHGPEAFGNKLFAAIRIPNGNTLIATGNGHSVLEVTPQKEIIWQIHQNDLPNIRLAWVTTLELLPSTELRSGNLVIGNCHAGPDQPLLIEIDRETKQVVWTFDRHADFGNNVSNSLLMNVAGQTIR